jgi:hypothetical protein
MKLYIETENGTTKNHPALEDNLIVAFGEIPANWEPFTRVSRPILGVYQALQSEEPSYTKVDGVWTDVWTVRELTAEEKTTKQQEVRNIFNLQEYAENWSAWILDETTCTMVPPIPRPEPNLMKIGLGVSTVWSGVDNNWKDTPRRPFDGKIYKFNFTTWQWVEVTTS